MRTQSICLALAIVLLCPFVSAQWVRTNGPYGGPGRCFAVSGTNLFAGTDGGGVFLSTNNGASWTAASTGLTYLEVNALAVSGTNLFAGVYWRGGVFLSTNNGTSWTRRVPACRILISMLLPSRARISLPALMAASGDDRCRR